MVCINCEFTYEGKFCPNCSQKAHTHRFSVAHFAHEAFHAVTHTDKGIFFLIKELFKNPGRVAREYNEGKRKKYFNPVTFLLIVLALQIYAGQKTNIYDSYLDQTTAFVLRLAKNVPDPKGEGVRQLDAAKKNLQEGKMRSAKITENNKVITFVLLPVLALLTWLLFKRSGFNYAENLVFNVIIAGQLCVIFLLTCVVPFLIYPPSIMILMLLYLVSWWIYSFIAYRQFFKQRWGWVILKGTVIQVIYLIIVSQVGNLVVAYM